MAPQLNGIAKKSNASFIKKYGWLQASGRAKMAIMQKMFLPNNFRTNEASEIIRMPSSSPRFNYLNVCLQYASLDDRGAVFAHRPPSRVIWSHVTPYVFMPIALNK